MAMVVTEIIICELDESGNTLLYEYLSVIFSIVKRILKIVQNHVLQFFLKDCV